MWNMEFMVTLADAIGENMVGMTMAQQEQYIFYWVRQASNGLELQALMMAIGSSYDSARATDRAYDFQIHQLGQGPAYRGEQGTEIQRAAFFLLQCTEFTKCGPNSVLTLTECFMRQVCEPGWSMNDLIYNMHSPLEDEQILAVLDNLYSVRKGLK